MLICGFATERWQFQVWRETKRGRSGRVSAITTVAFRIAGKCYIAEPTNLKCMCSSSTTALSVHGHGYRSPKLLNLLRAAHAAGYIRPMWPCQPKWFKSWPNCDNLLKCRCCSFCWSRLKRCQTNTLFKRKFTFQKDTGDLSRSDFSVRSLASIKSTICWTPCVLGLLSSSAIWNWMCSAITLLFISLAFTNRNLKVAPKTLISVWLDCFWSRFKQLIAFLKSFFMDANKWWY